MQANLLNGLSTGIVAPLLPVAKVPVPARRLNPAFEIGTNLYVMVTQFMASIPGTLLHAPVASLAEQDSEIMAALDMVLVGF